MALVFGKAVVNCFVGLRIQAIEILGLELLEALWDGVIAAILKVGPDDVCLGEAEDTKLASSHGVILAYPKAWFLKDRVSPGPPGPWIWHSRSCVPCHPQPRSGHSRCQENTPTFILRKDESRL